MIEVQGLTKKYGPVEAVKGVSFTVGQDQVLGFLGPNGAGKTTIMKILTGYHYPTEGTAKIDGIPVQEDPVEVKKRIGYLPESVPLYGDLTVTEYLGFIARARLIRAEDRKRAIEESIAACGLEQVRRKRIETLSKGFKQRAGLAQAIIHDPPILILDEPTTGLDPNQIIEIRALIKGLGKRKTVILSTHILQEVEAVCSQVLIINAGSIAAQGKPEEIAGTLKGGDTWELVLKTPDTPASSAAASIGEKLKSLGAGGELSQLNAVALDDGTVKASFFLGGDTGGGPGAGNGAGEAIFDWAVSRGFKILMMNRKKLSLEDIFVKLTSDTEGAGAADGGRKS
ncbi:MAG: ATP-binding cassette domain-containing protein [Spirochaetaceae bacterium]|jgi:ABC-2 type transport system ATP-binding protein|nr:ATP-binding cassette domain-containing protein [Spirochaetaceae bacterium]